MNPGEVAGEVELRFGLLASHDGTNVQAHIDAWEARHTTVKPVIVISNNRSAGALERGRRHGIQDTCLNSSTHPDPEALDLAIRDALRSANVDLVALCGFMKKIGPRTLEAFSGRILNVHTGPLPHFGGQGMYGRRIHEAVLSAGLRETEVCIFVIEPAYDTRPVIARRSVAVLPDDDPDTLAQRVLPVEHELSVDTIRRIALRDIELPTA